MGSLFGAMLSPVSEIFLIDPFVSHVKEIKKNGLKIEKNHGSVQRYDIFAATKPDKIKNNIDLAIIFTKSHLTENAAHTAKSILSKQGMALTLQNGLGNFDIIAGVLGRKRVIAGVTSHGGTLVKPGYIRHAGSGMTYIAAGSGSDKHPFVIKVMKTFNSAGIDTKISDNLESLIWGKLVINAGINALAAILHVPNGILGITRECEIIMEHAVSEAVMVADALGITLPYEHPVEHVKKVCASTAKNRASMLQDVLRGANTEIAVINRAVAQKGKELGVPVLYNIFLSEIIEAVEATYKNRINPVR